VCVYIFTQLSFVHHAVFRKTLTPTVSGAVHFGVWAPFLQGYQCIEITSSWKIQVNFFLPSNKEFRLQVHFCIKWRQLFISLAWSLLSAPFSYTENNPLPICTFQTCTCKTAQILFEGLLLNSQGNIQTLHDTLCWRYTCILMSDTPTQLFFPCIF